MKTMIISMLLIPLMSGVPADAVPQHSSEMKNTSVLTQEMVDAAGQSVIVSGNYSLDGKTIVLPQGTLLEFKGGSIDNGEIVGAGNKVKVSQKKPAFGKSLKISGFWNVPEIKDFWFEFDDSPDFVSNGIIGNMLALACDDVNNHIVFDEPRTYLFELPYKGRADIGNMVSYKMVDGKKKRHYSDIYKDEYSFLRIFTIPSNTRMTVNSRLQMLPTSVGAYFIFWEYGKENVTVDGRGAIAGDNAVHKYDSPYAGTKFFGEWGFIFRCFKCKNFIFRDITLSDSFGDAIIYMGTFKKSEPGRKYADGLIVDNVKIIGARRNGIAIGARNVTIKNSHFENCGSKSVKGTDPKCAIDFESDHLSTNPEVYCDNVVVKNCTFKNNNLDIHSYNNVARSHKKNSVTVIDCSFTSPLSINSSRWMTFRNCHIPSFQFSDKEYSMFNDGQHYIFENCTFGRLTKTRYEAAKIKNKFTDCKVENWD